VPRGREKGILFFYVRKGKVIENKPGVTHAPTSVIGGVSGEGESIG
jgi:hypothetical protein